MAFGYIGKAADQEQAAKKGVYSIKEHFATQPENDGLPESGIPITYLIIGGGAGGGHGYSGNRAGGGGGAGGYRTNMPGESSGGNSGLEPIFYATPGTNYEVSIGGGSNGSGTAEFSAASEGTVSYFGEIYSKGGGPSGGHASRYDLRMGGSASGGVSSGVSGRYIETQGSAGHNTVSSTQTGGGAAGAGGAATAGVYPNGGAGGAGLASSITGSSVTRAGGGGGGAYSSGTGGTGGSGGGGAGAAGSSNGSNGTANTGSGGGGTGAFGGYGGNGGSGVVILRYPKEFAITTGSSLTAGTETTDGEEKYIVITAGTDDVSWSRA